MGLLIAGAAGCGGSDPAGGDAASADARNGPPADARSGSDGSVGDPDPLALIVVGDGGDSVDDDLFVFDIEGDGELVPVREILSPALIFPRGLAYAADHREIIVSSAATQSIAFFAHDAGGTNVAPLREIERAVDWLPSGIAYDPVADEVYVCDAASDAIHVFPRSVSGEVEPTRTVWGPETGILNCLGVAFDSAARELYVFDQPGDIRVWPAQADGDVPPTRVIEVEASLGSGDPRRAAIDHEHGELIVADPKNGIISFPLDATGEADPTRRISGPKTLLDALASDVAYDPDRDEIFVAAQNHVLVFDRLDDGDVLPKRWIEPPAGDDVSFEEAGEIILTP